MEILKVFAVVSLLTTFIDFVNGNGEKNILKPIIRRPIAGEKHGQLARRFHPSDKQSYSLVMKDYNTRQANRHPIREEIPVPLLAYSYSPKEKRPKMIRETIQVVRRVFERILHTSYSEDPNDMTLFLKLLESYVGSRRRIPIGDFLLKEVGLSKEALTYVIDELHSYNHALPTIHNIYKQYPNTINSLYQHLIPERISPPFVGILITYLDSIPTYKGGIKINNIIRLCKGFLHKYMKGVLYFKQIYDVKTKQFKIPVKILSEPLGDSYLPRHNFLFFLKNLEGEILSHSPYHVAVNYLSREISPWTFEQTKLKRNIICSNRMLQRVKDNDMMTPSEKIKVLSIILDRYIPKTPQGCYFMEDTYYDKGIKFYEDLLEQQMASKELKEKWQWFIDTLAPNEMEGFLFVRKLRKEQYRLKIREVVAIPQTMCVSNTMNALLTRIAQKKPNATDEFCQAVQSCKDISFQVTSTEEVQVPLFNEAVSHCGAQTILSDHIESIVYRYSVRKESLERRGLFNLMVSFCLKNSIENRLLPVCEVLRHTDPLYNNAVNIFNAPIAMEYLDSDNLTFILNLGFDLPRAIKSLIQGLILNHYKERLMDLMQLPGFFSALLHLTAYVEGILVLWFFDKLSLAPEDSFPMIFTTFLHSLRARTDPEKLRFRTPTNINNTPPEERVLDHAWFNFVLQNNSNYIICHQMYKYLDKIHEKGKLLPNYQLLKAEIADIKE